MSLIKIIVLYIWFTKFVIATIDLNILKTKLNKCQNCGTELINDEDPLLFLSTLNGSFISVNHRTGKIIWQFKEEAAVKVPVDTKNALMPLFLPDPKDGSLYLYNSENHADLKKLQFTIQQLVTSSPCRSSDGIFYTGKKVDNWFVIDYRTGIKEELIDIDDSEKMCPLIDTYSMFLGRTEYSLIIHDISRKDRKWNVTFYDYSAKVMPPEKIKNYEHLYFAGSSTGKFTVLKNTAGHGPFLWEADFKSPIIGVYIRDGDELVSLPFTTMDDSSMHFLNLPLEDHIQLYSTLYIGEHSHGLYALPAVATAESTILLLNGPSNEEILPVVLNKNEETTALLGYYKMPDYQIQRLLITGRTDAIIEINQTVYNKTSSKLHGYKLKTVAVQTDGDNSTSDFKFDRYMLYHFVNLCSDYVTSERNIELKVFMVIMIIITTYMFVYFRAQVRDLKQSSSNESSRNSLGYSSSSIVTAITEELPNGKTKVGKILFDSNQILGKGCEGTFVFKGQFDDRNVAVKRLLPECFTVADREVCLLRESDQHPHVIRYFCMEQDKQFRYIALELCAATLQDYTEKGILNDYISPSEALAQATAGLEHLHALHIVHRDIKPHNVLLSFPSSQENKVRAMISDFGLCKKLQTGRVSFSRKSGITGTDGWIAPEIINGKCRTTAAVDIFSLGCVFYYVLSKGKHPFGDSLRRQANIMSGDFQVNEINDDKCELWSHLIARMVTVDPLDRPSINVIKSHPAFWNKDKILTFLQDVSDRIEKEQPSSKVMLELETGNSCVLNGDWKDLIEPEIADDLAKYRSYRADSLRDLLRALRNKKHHYRELSDTVRQILGNIPDQFVMYWTDRFPKLLLHTWLSMQCVRNEDVFKKYYCTSYTFPRISDNIVPLWIQQSINLSPRKKISPKGNNSSKYYNKPYTINKYFSTFFFKEDDKLQEYSWRVGSKIPSINDSDECSEHTEEINVNNITSNSVNLNNNDIIIEDKVIAINDDNGDIAIDDSIYANEDELLLDKINNSMKTLANKENYVMLFEDNECDYVDDNEGISEIIEDSSRKWQKHARHRVRGRNRNRKKQIHTNNEKDLEK